MRIRHLIAAAVLLLIGSAPASAVVSRNLYEASVAVPDQGTEARAAGLRAALETVLVRVTGAHPLRAEATPLLSRANDLVQGYGYEAAPSGTGLKLKAQFDARAVDAALRSASLPVWGASRPYHLAWIAVRDDSPPRQLLDAANAHAAAVAATAEARGLPLNLPALDATERHGLDFTRVWGNDVPAIREASRRYAADALVVGRVGREGGQWVGHWTLLDNSSAVQEWSEGRDTLDEALAAGIDALADRQAVRFAVQGGRAQELRVSVSNVQGVKDYGRALNYLRSLGAVRSAQVERALDDRLTFRVRVEGDPDALSRMIGSGNVMRANSSTPPGVDQAYVLVTQ